MNKTNILQYTLYMGLNDKDTKTQKISMIEAYKIIENIIVQRFGGGTISEATGIYKHDNGQIVTEKTITIKLLFTDETSVKDLVKDLKVIFNQESIIVEKSYIDSEMW